MTVRDRIPPEVAAVPGAALSVVALAVVLVALPATFALVLLAGVASEVGAYLVRRVLLGGALVTGAAAAVAIATTIVCNLVLVVWSLTVPRAERRSINDAFGWRIEAAGSLLRPSRASRSRPEP